MKFEFLQQIALWPKFEDPDLTWANFPASTPQLQQRWYSRQMTSSKHWFAVFKGENYDGPLLSKQLIARVSLSEPTKYQRNQRDVILGIVLRPDMLSKGYGLQIMQLVMKLILEKSEFSGIWLESSLSNSRAISLWKKLGFEETGRHYRTNPYGKFEAFVGYRLPREKFDQIDDFEVFEIK